MPEHINFHSLAAEPRKRITREFGDPILGERKFAITFETPDAYTDYLAADVAGQLVKRYLTGDEELGMPAQPFLVDGEPRKLTERMCDHAGLIVAMQPEPPEYQPEEVLMMAYKARGVWIQVRAWAQALFAGAEDALGEALTGRREASSSDPLSKPDTSIRVSSSTWPVASGVSTIDLQEAAG